MESSEGAMKRIIEHMEELRKALEEEMEINLRDGIFYRQTF